MQRVIAIAAFLTAALACVEALTLILVADVTTEWCRSIVGAANKQEA